MKSKKLGERTNSFSIKKWDWTIGTNPWSRPLRKKELQNKKTELARLEAQIVSEKKAANQTSWLGLGIVLAIITLSTSLLIKEKRKFTE